jgi:hypothetical protein
MLKLNTIGKWLLLSVLLPSICLTGTYIAVGIMITPSRGLTGTPAFIVHIGSALLALIVMSLILLCIMAVRTNDNEKLRLLIVSQCTGIASTLLGFTAFLAVFYLSLASVSPPPYASEFKLIGIASAFICAAAVCGVIWCLDRLTRKSEVRESEKGTAWIFLIITIFFNVIAISLTLGNLSSYIHNY